MFSSVLRLSVMFLLTWKKVVKNVKFWPPLTYWSRDVISDVVIGKKNGTYSRKSMLSIGTPYVALILKGKLFIFDLKSQPPLIFPRFKFVRPGIK